MSLTGPRFQTTLYDVTLPNPSDWDVVNLVGEGRQRTLDGTETTDIYYRKYEYRLKWDTLGVTDYNNLLQLIEHQVDRAVDITFTWGKFPQSVSGVKVFARMPNRGFKAGKGATSYYSQIELILTDNSNRQS